MKNAVVKDTIREITKTKARFFSIFAIILIGTAFFSGISASPYDMRYSADKYFDDNNLMDFKIVSTLGITENDFDEIKAIEGIEDIYPSYTKDFFTYVDSNKITVRVGSFNSKNLASNENYINQVIIKEGRLPTNKNEIIVESSKLVEYEINVGDTITLSMFDQEELNDTLNNVEFEVVGKVSTPYYLSYQKGNSDNGSGAIDLYMYIDEDNFELDYYTEVFATIKNSKEYNSFNDEYFDFLKPFKQDLETLGSKQSIIRKDEIINEANETLNEGILEYDENLELFNEEIKKGEQEISDAKDDLMLGKAQLETNVVVGQMQLDQGQMQLDSAKKQIETLNAEYEKLKAEFDKIYADKEAELVILNENLVIKQAEISEIEIAVANKNAEIALQQEQLLQLQLELIELENQDIIDQELINAKTLEINKLNEEISLNKQDPIFETEKKLKIELIEINTKISLIEAEISYPKQALEILKKSVDIANVEYNNGVNELNNQKQLFDQEIAKAKVAISDGENSLAKASVDFEVAKIENQILLDDALIEIQKGQAEILKIEDGKWYILDRNQHYSYVDYKGATDRMDAIAVVFPVFFYLVAALVCLTTMTRLVDERRSQIGTMKALGYKNYQIAAKYIAYAAIASFLGALSGLAIGMYLFPLIIYNAWNLMYVLPPISYDFLPKLMFISLFTSVAVTTLVTYNVCHNELKENPSLLMRPKPLKAGKKIMLERIDFIWNRLSFTSKVTARNIFRYKKRMLMTIIGISGCCALLIAGFGIKDSISDIVDIQFTQVLYYDAYVSFDKDISESIRNESIDKIINLNEVDDVMDVYSENAKVINDDKIIDVSVMVASDTKQFSQFITLKNRVNDNLYSLSNDGVAISEQLASDNKIRVGDFIEVEIDGITRSVKVESIFENYVNHYIYMSNTYYSDIYEVTPTNNQLLVKSNELDTNKLSVKLLEDENVESIEFFKGFADSFSDTIKSLNLIVLVLIISAGSLAFVVLYNLTNVNISERLREIATLKVLGFHDDECNSYVYKENIILTLMGSFVGIFLGKLLHLVIMVVVELDTIMFGRNINLISYIMSIGLTLFFAIIVNRVMRKKLRNIEMVESLKSVE